MLTRILDLAVLLLLAAAILMPGPDAKVSRALKVDDQQRERVAELQMMLLADPGDPAAALELADIFLDGRRPDWAMTVLGEPIRRHPADHRLFLRRSLALAEHFEAAAAHQAALKAQTLCDNGSALPCGEADRSRIALLVSTLDRVKNIDMRKDPNAAKERIIRALRPAYNPLKAVKPPATPPAPPTP